MRIYKINDDKFKSIYISYNFTFEVKDESDFSNSVVLAALMSKTSNKYRTLKEKNRYLNFLYGASFFVNTQRFGDLYNIEFGIEYINKEFLPDKEELLYKVLYFLKEMIYNPADWSEKEIQREKAVLANRINKQKDDKFNYAIKRVEELLCKDEPFGTALYGGIENVESVDKSSLIKAYDKLLDSCVTIIVSGNLCGYDDIDKKINEVFKNCNNSTKKITDLVFNTKKESLSNIEVVNENIDATQSILTVGMKINNCNADDFYALNLYNLILGGAPSSKLFQNVREKESLAYDISSIYNCFKDIIIIYAGINKDNYNKALRIIEDQITQIKQGKITDIEFNSAKDMLIESLIECNDSKISLLDNKLMNIIKFKTDSISIDDAIEQVKKITIDDIVRVANLISTKKIFFLGGIDNA